MEHMQPLDLLRLSRTTKAFRQILMRRTSVRIWRTARSRFAPDLPDCPSWMSEPQYANLLFDLHCHVRRSRLQLFCRCTYSVLGMLDSRHPKSRLEITSTLVRKMFKDTVSDYGSKLLNIFLIII